MEKLPSALQNLRRSSSRTTRQIGEPNSFIAWFIKIVYGLVIIVTITFMLPQNYRSYHLDLDDITDKDIIAPYNFTVYKLPEVLAEEQKKAERSVYAFVQHDSLQIEKSLHDIENFFSDVRLIIDTIQSQSDIPVDTLYMIDPQLFEPLKTLRRTLSDSTVVALLSPDKRSRLEEMTKAAITTVLKKGVIDSKDVFSQEFHRIVNIVHNDSTITMKSIDDIYSQDEAFQYLTNLSVGTVFDQNFKRALTEISRKFIHSNLIYDKERTQKERAAAREAVPKQLGKVYKDERILSAHERVTENHLVKIRSLEAMQEQNTSENILMYLILPVLARILAIVMILALIGYYLYTYRTHLFYDNFRLLAITLIFLITLCSVYFIHLVGQLSIFLIPFATSAILLCILFDSKVALRLVLSLSLLSGILLDYDFFIMFFAVVSGSVGIYSVRRVRNRSEFYRSMISIPIANVLLVIATTSTMISTTATDFIYQLMLGILNGVMSPILAIGLLPVFESIFRISTDITLLELSDPNHPLLRKLALYTPGTFHHSLMVGNLSEAAADSIGANTLLTRVSCYYHDVGKILKPDYFVENQRNGLNPHDKLKPNMSALILKSHVKEGIRLAREYKLPQEVIDIIPQHHGTSLISFFYHKALEEDPKTTLTERDFRYDGPKPQTKEAGIIMLADSVEAVSRVLKDPTPSSLRGMVRNITMKRFQEGELDECELTLKDLNKINEAFLRVLTGVFHTRIEYPNVKKDDDSAKKKLEPKSHSNENLSDQN